MPRQSAEGRAAIPTAVPAARIAPPGDLTPEQARDWQAITAKLPSHWFGGDNAPVLRELVRHMSYARQIGEALADMRKQILHSNAPLGAKQRAIFNQLCRMHAGQSKAIAMLSVKLRLTNSSHRNDRFDERRLRTMPDGRRPWEDRGAGQH